MPSIKPSFISVIIPVFNEGKQLQHFIQKVIECVGLHNQIIIVDGGSTDECIQALSELAKTTDKLTITTAPKSRALQMNAGAKLAKADILLFLHADTLLPETALSDLNEMKKSQYKWGRFDVCLNNKALVYKVISWFINKRSRLTSISTGDQAIFVRRDIFEEINGYTNQPLMEDVDLSVRLKKTSKPYCIASCVTTSARKWEKGGVIKTVLLMWRLRLAYAMGKKPEQLVKMYYSD